MSEATPPPFRGDTTSVRSGFRFSTATLLGLTTLVAVACALAVTIPGLLSLILAILVNFLIVAYAAFLIAGAWASFGDRRLFCTAALGCLLLVGMTNATDTIAWRLHSSGIALSSLVMEIMAKLIAPIELVALSLLGGWIAVRTQRFWTSREVPNSTQESPIAAVKTVP